MRNGKFIKMIFQTQNVKRWGDYAPHFNDVVASHSFRGASIAVILTLIEEKVFNKKIDKFKVVGGCLLGNSHETITCSIKHVTKKDPEVSRYIQDFEKQAAESIVRTTLSDKLQPLFNELIVNAEDDTYEGRMVEAINSFDALLFCHREKLLGSNPHFRVYCDVLKNKVKECGIASVQWLLEEFEKGEGIYEFLNYILMLDTVERWSDKFNMIPDNDATHTFRMASVALFIALFEEKYLNKKSVNLFSLLCKCLMHDLPEQVTGDVLGPLKHSSSEVKKAFEKYEKKTSMAMIEKLPKIIREEIVDMMVECKNDTPEGDIVDIADKVDAFFKSAIEMDINPKVYRETYKKQLKKLKNTYRNRKIVKILIGYMFRDIRQLKFRSHLYFVVNNPILYLKKVL